MLFYKAVLIRKQFIANFYIFLYLQFLCVLFVGNCNLVFFLNLLKNIIHNYSLILNLSKNYINCLVSFSFKRLINKVPLNAQAFKVLFLCG